MKAVHMVAFVLLVVGGVNWGLVGLGQLMSSANNWNLVAMILGSMPMLENLVYVVVGVSAVVVAFGHKSDCKTCGSCEHQTPAVGV